MMYIWSKATGVPHPQYLTVGMAEFEVPVTKCEVWVVTTAFDADNRGQVGRGVMHTLRLK